MELAIDLSWASQANYIGFDKILQSVEDETFFGTNIFNLTATKLLLQQNKSIFFSSVKGIFPDFIHLTHQR